MSRRRRTLAAHLLRIAVAHRLQRSADIGASSILLITKQIRLWWSPGRPCAESCRRRRRRSRKDARSTSSGEGTAVRLSPPAFHEDHLHTRDAPAASRSTRSRLIECPRESRYAGSHRSRRRSMRSAASAAFLTRNSRVLPRVDVVGHNRDVILVAQPHWQSAAASVVLPEPTGPPMPTLSACFMI